jgi:hypothetical protein
MLNARTFWFSRYFVIFFLITLTACSQQQLTTASPIIVPAVTKIPNTNISPPPKPKPLKHYKIRNGKRLKAIYFPQRRLPITDKEGESILGLVAGKLILQKGCLRVEDVRNSKLIIWPGWLSYSVEDDTIIIKYPTRWHKTQYLKIGDRIFIGGDELAGRPDPKFLAQSIPDKCKGPYWWAIEDIRLHTPEPK